MPESATRIRPWQRSAALALQCRALEAPETSTLIALDNHRRAVTESPAMARMLAEGSGHTIESLFLGEPVLPYRSCYPAGE